jgi:hypothetical protein
MNAEQQAKRDYEQGRYREGFGIPDEYREAYLIECEKRDYEQRTASNG